MGGVLHEVLLKTAIILQHSVVHSLWCNSFFHVDIILTKIPPLRCNI